MPWEPPQGKQQMKQSLGSSRTVRVAGSAASVPGCLVVGRQRQAFGEAFGEIRIRDERTAERDRVRLAIVEGGLSFLKVVIRVQDKAALESGAHQRRDRRPFGAAIGAVKIWFADFQERKAKI
jgi:hypothetical protein